MDEIKNKWTKLKIKIYERAWKDKKYFNISLILIQYLDNLTGLPRLRRLSLVNNNLTITQVGTNYSLFGKV